MLNKLFIFLSAIAVVSIVCVSWLKIGSHVEKQGPQISFEKRSFVNIYLLSAAKREFTNSSESVLVIEPDKGNPSLGAVVERYHADILRGKWESVYDYLTSDIRFLVNKDQYIKNIESSKINAISYYVLGFQRMADQDCYQVVTLLHYKCSNAEEDIFCIETWIYENSAWKILRGDDQPWCRTTPFCIKVLSKR